MCDSLALAEYCRCNAELNAAPSRVNCVPTCWLNWTLACSLTGGGVTSTIFAAPYSLIKPMSFCKFSTYSLTGTC